MSHRNSLIVLIDCLFIILDNFRGKNKVKEKQTNWLLKVRKYIWHQYFKRNKKKNNECNNTDSKDIIVLKKISKMYYFDTVFFNFYNTK